jgi:uncharacterized protein YydD (DUF2326 family)
MKIIKLYADKASFQAIDFNQSGLSIVIGCKDGSEKSHIKKTYNGVGKTLMLYLINFCLASGEIKAFKEKLPNWLFCLDFSVDGKHYTACRNTSGQNEIILNGETLALEAFKKKFATDVFFLNEDMPHIKFRSLLAKFMRRSKDEYSNYAGVSQRAVGDWATVLILSYLLGLDYSKSLNKSQLKVDLDEVGKFKKNLQNDPVISEYLNLNVNAEIELVDLEEKIAKLRQDLADFMIAENYHDIQKQADGLAAQIQALSNQAFSLAHSLKQIEKSLAIKADVDSSQVYQLYENVGLQLPEQLKKTVDDVQHFHKALLGSRVERLLQDQASIKKQQNELEKKRKALSQEQDALLRYLQNKGALEERDALKQKLSDFEHKRQALSQGHNLIKEYEIKKSELKSRLDKESTETEKYLNSEQGKQIKDSNLRLFRRLANHFYQDKDNGFTIENNGGTNRVRYTLNPHIDHDASDGINEVKIFCFDWMLLLGRHRHSMRVLLHDSRLFDAMDERQAATALRIAMEECQRQDLQYIITLNESKYLNIIRELEQHGFHAEARVLEQCKVKELTDKSERSKLLGINVELKYDV